jgi:hypothetical protein
MIAMIYLLSEGGEIMHRFEIPEEEQTALLDWLTERNYMLRLIKTVFGRSAR